jgi:hypothetical protein
MMEALKEITVWKDITHQPNHIYLMEGDKMHAYIKWGQGKPEYFKNPIRIDKRGRKFVKADVKLFDIPKQESSLVEVKGSKGNSYWVDPEAQTCTCPGFTFRGTCKHIGEVCGN